MPKDKIEIHCRYEGASIRRYGEVIFRFRIGEGQVNEAAKALLSIERKSAAKIAKGDQNYVLGPVEFAGIRFDRHGESVLSLDSTVGQTQLQLGQINELAEQDIVLTMVLGKTTGH